MKDNYLKGVVPALVTPLDRSGRNIDNEGLRTLINFQINKGVNGLFTLGSSGEGVLFDVETRKKVMKLTVDEVNERVPVVFHVGSHRPQEVLDLAEYAVQIKSNGVAIIPPFYYSLDDSALFQYFKKIAEKIEIPIYLYNIPSNTKNSISVPLFKKLADRYPHIIGMKESSMNFENFYELVQSAGETHSTLMGNDEQFLPALTMGGSGAVSAGATAIPEPFVALYQAYNNGDMEEAKEWQSICADVKKMLAKPYPIGTIKKALEFRGIISGTVSAPLRQLDEKETNELKQTMLNLGYLNIEATN
ncbi:dihydrodipicolinate synthase family protein [Salibacterium salarium]|uniref:Dihydrodipicolinate synthase family protein n=1 Tax=Salibacterium salarium TaxID=284579 RepID=A0A428N536_9BACI|nr:dihydrodipicolinate synthase family protein [Salibacterium salarium]RSL33603.1 dihydrodipicolinate synthase family protein [Salibacterium salarium]